MKKFIITTIVFLISIQFLYSQDGNNAWTLKGSGMGRIYCGVINPSNQNILYVAGLDSGIYKTTNGGANWFAVNNGVTYKKSAVPCNFTFQPRYFICGNRFAWRC